MSRVRLLALALHEQPSWRPLLRLAGTASRAWARLRHPNAASDAAVGDWVRRPRTLESPETAREADWMASASHLDAYLYRSFHFTILPTLLRTFDRLSMAHGVEVRMPFLDWRLVCYAFSLPPEAKIGGGYTKRILREAMKHRIPRAIRTRRAKIGFNSPMLDWFRGPLRVMLRDVVREREFLDSDLWDGPAIAAAVDRHLATDRWTWNEALRVWTFLHAHWYVRRFCAT
jgi:asparagine synthetase B (glutamine-hydrolysing)